MTTRNDTDQTYQEMNADVQTHPENHGPHKSQHTQPSDTDTPRTDVDEPIMDRQAPYTDIGTIHHRRPDVDLQNYRDIESSDESQQWQIDEMEHGTGSVER